MPPSRVHAWVVAALLLAAAGSATAQPLPDTLDWHRYMPLAVGNVREYRVREGEPLLIRAITGDTTLADGRIYFVMDEASYEDEGGGFTLFSRLTWYVRYDTAGTYVAVRDLSADPSALPAEHPLDGGPYFDLRAAFADTVRFGPGVEQYYAVTGGYGEALQVEGATYTAPAVKHFNTPYWYAGYAADVGYLGGGNLWGPELTYARVGGVEYGLRRLSTAVEEDPLPTAGLAVVSLYPNPVWERATVAYRQPVPGAVRVAVYDALGRRLLARRLPVRPAGTHAFDLAAGAWPPGVYAVRLSMGNGWGHSRLFVHRR